MPSKLLETAEFPLPLGSQVKPTRAKLIVSTTLDEACTRQDISLPNELRVQINRYCQLLWSWNERLNLTRHLDYDTFVARDVVDSIQLADCLVAGEKVLDVGSGGGVPGMLVAILRPDVSVTLSDSIEKKTKALSSMVTELKLPVSVLTSRVQDLFPKQRFDTLVARAVGPTVKILRWIEPHWKSFGRLLLIKGPRWVDERKEARHKGLMASIDLRVLKKYPMPGTDSESVILSFQQAE